MAVPLVAPTSWPMRTAAVACGCALAAAAVTVAVVDPSSPTSRFPACPFHTLTGLWCPGCGLTRATHALLRGDVAGAISRNVFTPFVLVAIVLAWASWTLTAFGRPTRNPVERLPRWFGPVLLSAFVVYGVLRNLPVPALRTLAP